MNYEMTIFNSEKDFRKYVIQNRNNISQIIVFEDILDHVVFFYCFNQNKILTTAKETKYKDFSTYYKIYSLLSKKFNLNVINKFPHIPSIILVS